MLKRYLGLNLPKYLFLILITKLNTCIQFVFGEIEYVKILSRVGGTRDDNNGFWIGWLDLLALRLQSLLITTRTYKQYSAIADLHTFQCSVAHALWFSVSTSRILATDITSNHCDVLSFLLQPPWTVDSLNSDLRRLNSPILSPVWSSLLDANTLSFYSLGILFTYINVARTRIIENACHVIAIHCWVTSPRITENTCHVIANQPVH
jgi:hypothetical protein